ncbi:MAG TPA: glycosyltransferase [Gaiellaceae bacterium]|jgi:GT2 family glycosyltransferase|nr:glycosyltransferase [Gaiellaceae bacterium]
MSEAKTETRRAGSSFVIATRNRPGYLLDTVRSLLGQTVLPAELCIVDSSDETPARGEIEQLCADAAVRLIYVHPAPSGLPRQRNIGVERTSGDPIFFVDDDVSIAPAAHEEVLAEYERWGPELGGVRGSPLRPQRPARPVILWRRFFGLGGWWPEASGRVRGGFFAENANALAEPRRVEFFNGLFPSFRREVFAHERFDDALEGYAFKEDVDFSYRVSRRGYVLVQTPRALVDHLKAPSERLPPFQLQRMMLANQFYLHRKNMPQTLRNRAALWWALGGMAMLNAGKVVQTRDRGYLTGLFVGAWEQAHGRGLIDPARERDGEG